jgi:hypothetical protein
MAALVRIPVAIGSRSDSSARARADLGHSGSDISLRTANTARSVREVVIVRPEIRSSRSLIINLPSLVGGIDMVRMAWID